MQHDDTDTTRALPIQQGSQTGVLTPVPAHAPADTLPASPSPTPTVRTRRASRRAPTHNTDGAGEPAAPAPRRHIRKAAQHPAVADVAESADGATAAPPDTLAAPLQPRSSTGTRRRTNGPMRGRESGVLGLAERARLASERQVISPLLDPLLTALPTLRRALLNAPLDDALRQIGDTITQALAPAALQFWIADPAPLIGGARPGGQQLLPTVHLRASATALTRMSDAASGALANDLFVATPTAPLATPVPPLPDTNGLHATPDPLIDEALATRRPVILNDADEHPLAGAWTLRLPAPTALFTPSPALGTLAAYPLRARGQFLGALALATRGRLASRQLAALEEIADLAALAADRDSLLSYSHSQEALAQTMVRHSPVAMAAFTGPDHVFAFANPTFGLLLGLDGEANVIGRRLEDVAPERARSLIASLRIEAVYAGGETQAMNELPIHLDRGRTYWNVTTSPIPGLSTETGAGRGVLVAAVDVTHLAQARLRAQESAEVAQDRIGQMMTLHATTLATASQLGADPHDLLANILRRSIALLNARAGAIYARDGRRDELEVRVCQGLRGDYAGARIRMGEGFAGQVAQTGKGMIIDDYRAWPYHAAIYGDEDFSAGIAVPLIHHGQVVGVLDVLDDAERRTFTDDDLWLLDLFAAQAAQTMENARLFVELERAYHKQRELDRLKDDFIATASHELRTPLTGVQGFLELLLDYTAEQGDPLVVEFTQKAADSAQELAEIAERLLQTSRLDTGRLELHSTPVRLAQAVEDSLRSFRELQAAQGATHDLIGEVPSDVYVQADLGRLKEALDNLISNAIKYSPQGGRVRVQCARVRFRAPAAALGGVAPDTSASVAHPAEIEERPTLVLPQLSRDASGALIDPDYDPSAPASAVIAAASAQPYYVALVSDEGIGIAPEERSRLFGRFARLDAARISQIRGTGLGLYICRQMMRAMGGDVWLYESAPGRGSVFALALPGAEHPTSASAEYAIPEP